ncbi:MAG: hypothetical protein INR71_00500, partial [Terriglobus roseus]|nr:hypothetical protein [Terriglobus roseus]
MAITTNTNANITTTTTTIILTQIVLTPHFKDNYKPKLSASSTRTATVSADDNERATLVLADRSGDGGEESRTAYAGGRRDLKRSYALVLDPGAHTCTLHPLRSSYAFNVVATPAEPSAARLADRHPQLRPRQEPGSADGAAADGGGGAGDDERDTDPNGTPDPDNPYDYRHYLQHAREPSRSVSPEPARGAPAHASTTGRQTPLSRSNVGTPLALTASKRATAAAKARKASPPAGSTLSKSKGAGTPSVRLERRATAKAKPQPSKKIKSITQPKKNPTVKSDYYVHSSSSDNDDTAEPAPPVQRKHASSTASKSGDRPTKPVGGLGIDLGDPAPATKPPQRSAPAP